MSFHCDWTTSLTSHTRPPKHVIAFSRFFFFIGIQIKYDDTISSNCTLDSLKSGRYFTSKHYMCYCIASIHINTRWYVFCCVSSDIFRTQILGAQRSDIKTICLARPKTFCDGRCKTCSAIMRWILCSSSEGPSPAVLYIFPCILLLLNR